MGYPIHRYLTTRVSRIANTVDRPAEIVPFARRGDARDGRSPGLRVTACAQPSQFPSGFAGVQARRLQLRGQPRLCRLAPSEHTLFPFHPSLEGTIAVGIIANDVAMRNSARGAHSKRRWALVTRSAARVPHVPLGAILRPGVAKRRARRCARDHRPASHAGGAGLRG